MSTGELQILKSTVSGVSSCFPADLCCFSECLLTLSIQGQEFIHLNSQVKSFSFLVSFEYPGAGPMLVVTGGAVEECSFRCQAVGYLLCVLGQAAWPLWATVFLPVQCWSGQHIFCEVGVSIERAMYEPGV